MKINLMILYIISVVLVSCGNDTSPIKNVVDQNKTSNTKITTKIIENFNYLDFVLSAEGEKSVSTWSKYIELNIQINYLKKADISFFNGDTEVLQTFIDTLKSTIPNNLQINAIVSRVVIIETALLKLHDDLTLNNIDADTQLMSIKEVLVAFSNLNLRIDKKLDFDIHNKIQPN